MKLLLHICCAPCTIYPLRVLKKGGHDICGLFYNPNIHPYLECRRRLDTLQTFATKEGLKVLWKEEYPLEDFLRGVAFREEERCSYCYHKRLDYAAHIARRGRFEGFTTTMLYSKFQNHEMIRSIGSSSAKEYGIEFYYQDFREGWREGVIISKEMGMYRQQYCGCIYSEKDRFYQEEKRLHQGSLIGDYHLPDNEDLEDQQL